MTQALDAELLDYNGMIQLIHGYLAEDQSDAMILKEVVEICVRYYHIESFIYRAPLCLKVNEDQTLIQSNTASSFKDGTCYGSIAMSSFNNVSIYEYTLSVSASKGVAIGIDDVKCAWIKRCFLGRNSTYNYGYQSWDGHKVCPKVVAFHDNDYDEEYGPKYDENAKKKNEFVIKMIYNAYKGSLSFAFDGIDYGEAYDNIMRGDGLDYRLAIYMQKDTQIELIEYSKKSAVLKPY